VGVAVHPRTERPFLQHVFSQAEEISSVILALNWQILIAPLVLAGHVVKRIRSLVNRLPEQIDPHGSGSLDPAPRA
jgi:hypothetical protein